MFSKSLNKFNNIYPFIIYIITIMKQIKILFILFLFLVFLAGIYFAYYYGKPIDEYMDNQSSDASSSECPDLLIQQGDVLMLYNTKQPIVEGTNPMPFFNLDEYINYLEIQRKKGINCPVLFLQQENNAQGQDIYRMRPSPFELQGGLPSQAPIPIQVGDASRDNPPYNANNYPGFNTSDQYIGTYTEMDQRHDSTKQNKISDNPMDPNWAGTTYTQQMVDSGKYDENNITKPVLFAPKTAFYPSLPGPFAPPVDVL
jgi:hypothetical protein